MSIKYGFLTDLKAEKVHEVDGLGRANWRLLAPLVYSSRLRGLIVVPKGFKTDFASVPRLPLAYALTGDTAHASAVVHDYLCRITFQDCEITWAEAARVFKEAMKHEGVPGWRRQMMYLGVRYFGRQSRHCEKDST